ncbi:hypothetical protein [Anaeromyxobacter sp. SG66]|uniref:hypothetical protein n=1 Tax=Anaeromyxobacter sp. SG66 TaxID=2925410 RepID=UPI001F563114|nr:hypothetical protein [Anaeromyxobacter sp. SG66]
MGIKNSLKSIWTKFRSLPTWAQIAIVVGIAVVGQVSEQINKAQQRREAAAAAASEATARAARLARARTPEGRDEARACMRKCIQDKGVYAFCSAKYAKISKPGGPNMGEDLCLKARACILCGPECGAEEETIFNSTCSDVSSVGRTAASL